MGTSGLGAGGGDIGAGEEAVGVVGTALAFVSTPGIVTYVRVFGGSSVRWVSLGSDCRLEA